MGRPDFRLYFGPVNERDRKHWCEIGGCQEQILFFDAAATEVTKKEGDPREIWVCWSHGQLKLREDFDWWTHEYLDARVNETVLDKMAWALEKSECPDP
jgi:hypothetical protein